MNYGKGVRFALIAAIVSGISIFINSLAVKPFDASLFTFLKNFVVAILLFSVILFLKEFSSLKKLSKKQWIQLAFIGLIGGSIPFLLFFNALAHTSALNAAFIQKLMFAFTALLAVVFLKEKFSKTAFLGSILLVASVVLLFGISLSSFTFYDFLILIATLFWAIEIVISKHVLKNLSPSLVAFGRMFFGSLFLFAFLLFSGKIVLIESLTLNHFFWLSLTSVFLFAYVFSWYNGLKHINASIATSILLLGLPITAVLDALFSSKAVLPLHLFAYAVMAFGLVLMLKAQERIFFLNPKIVGATK